MAWQREERLELTWEQESESTRYRRTERLAEIDIVLGLAEDFTYVCGTAEYPPAELIDEFERLGGCIPGFAFLGGGELVESLLVLEQELLRKRVAVYR